MVFKHPPPSPKYLSSCLVWVMWRAPLRVGPESYRSIETQFPDIFLFFIFWDPIPRRFSFSFSLRPNFQTYFYSLLLLRPDSQRHICILYFSSSSSLFWLQLRSLCQIQSQTIENLSKLANWQNNDFFVKKKNRHISLSKLYLWKSSQF